MIPCLGRSSSSIRGCLLVLVLACVLPATALAALLILEAYAEGRAGLYERAQSTAASLSKSVDDMIGNATSGLQVLATCPSLVSGDLPAFQKQAQLILPLQSGNNIVLTDLQGQQRMNTLVPFGQPLPRHGNIALQQRVIQGDRPEISDLFIGGVTRRPLVAAEVPVHVQGRLAYTLAMGFFPDRFANMLLSLSPEPDWVISVFDRRGISVARTRSPERFVGKPGAPGLMAAMARAERGVVETETLEGVPVFAAFARSPTSGWSVAVGVPKQILLARLHRWIGWLVVVSLLMLALEVTLAMAIGRRVAGAIGSLVPEAAALGQGSVPAPRQTQLREVNAVNEAMRQAGQLLHLRTTERDQAARLGLAMRNQARRFEHAALHDPLTGLLNRAGFRQMLEQALQEAQAMGAPLAVLYLDIDDFKPVNDLHGHAVGDLLLQGFAGRLRAGLREGDVLARLGGDEFVALLPGLARDTAQAVAAHLMERLSQPYVLRDLRLEVRASVGLALYPEDGREGDALIEAADARMYAAKPRRPGDQRSAS